MLRQLGNTDGCKKENSNTNDTVVTPPLIAQDSVMQTYTDDYAQYSALAYFGYWGPYNLHDPSINKYKDYYYIYSTDVSYGNTGKCGMMFRKSKDLVNWKFVGWVFDGAGNPVTLNLGLTQSTNVTTEVITSKNMNDYNDFGVAAKVVPAKFDGFKLTGSQLVVNMPAKSVVGLELILK